MTAKRRNWTEEELNFLLFAYQSDYYTVDEIAQALDRPVYAIRSKAYSFSLKRPVKKDNLPDGYKRCSKCDTILPLDYFSKSSKGKNGLRSECKFCVKKYKKIYDEKRKAKTLGFEENIREESIHEENVHEENVREQTFKKCRKCEEVKPLNEFYRDRNLKDGHKNSCKLCESKRQRKWYINGGYKYD